MKKQKIYPKDFLNDFDLSEKDYEFLSSTGLESGDYGIIEIGDAEPANYWPIIGEQMREGNL